MVVKHGLIALLGFVLRRSEIDAEIGLFTNDFTPDADTVLGDLTEATWSGYARVEVRSLTWPDPTINGDGQGESDGPTFSFIASADLVPAVLNYGLFITIRDDAGFEKLFFATRFATPASVEFTSDAVEKKLNWFDADLTI